jgi:hypothetical protein
MSTSLELWETSSNGGGWGLIFWRKNLRGLEFGHKNLRCLTLCPLAGLPPRGASRPGLSGPGEGLAKPLDTLDNPVMPRGLGWLRICMDDRYARAGQGGEGVLGMVLILMDTWLNHTSPPKLDRWLYFRGSTATAAKTAVLTTCTSTTWTTPTTAGATVRPGPLGCT